MNRMTLSFLVVAGFIPGLHLGVGRLFAISTWPIEISPNFFPPAVENAEPWSTRR
jgi:hypothetical protein